MNWISVKERLPEKDGEYLCTSRWSEDEEYGVALLEYSTKLSPTIPEKMQLRVFDTGGAFGEMWSDGLDNIEEVIAWMELPEAYKEGE